MKLLPGLLSCAYINQRCCTHRKPCRPVKDNACMFVVIAMRYGCLSRSLTRDCFVILLAFDPRRNVEVGVAGQTHLYSMHAHLSLFCCHGGPALHGPFFLSSLCLDFYPVSWDAAACACLHGCLHACMVEPDTSAGTEPAHAPAVACHVWAYSTGDGVDAACTFVTWPWVLVRM